MIKQKHPKLTLQVVQSFLYCVVHSILHYIGNQSIGCAQSASSFWSGDGRFAGGGKAVIFYFGMGVQP